MTTAAAIAADTAIRDANSPVAKSQKVRPVLGRSVNQVLTAYLVNSFNPLSAKPATISTTYQSFVKPLLTGQILLIFCGIIGGYAANCFNNYDQIPGILVWHEGQVPAGVTWFSMI